MTVWVEKKEKMFQSPFKCLNAALGKSIGVRLKNGKEYAGVLQGLDEHMNLVLEKAETTINEEIKKLDTIVIRGDTIFYIRLTI